MPALPPVSNAAADSAVVPSHGLSEPEQIAGATADQGSGLLPEKPHTRDGAVAAAIFLVALFAYLVSPAQFVGNDTRPAVFTAVSLAKRGDFGLEEFAPILKGKRPDWPYYILPTRDGGAVSRLGPGPPVVALPFFAPVLWVSGRISESDALRLGRLTAAVCVALAAALLYLAARRLGARRGSSLVTTLLYAFGTCAFSVASQALWQHGPAQLFLALGLFLLARDESRFAPVAGAAFAAATVCRPPDMVFAAAAAVFAVAHWRRQPRRLGAFLLFATPLLVAQLAYNHRYFGAPWIFGQTLKVEGADALPDADYWANNPLIGIAGLLVSPSRGLLIYTPAFIALALLLRRTWRKQPGFLRLQLAGVVALIAVLSRYYGWYGGMSFGYRMLADAAPALCLLSAPVYEALAGVRRRVYLVAVGLSVIIHALGAYNYSAVDWDAHPDIDKNRHRLWSITDSQLRYVVTHRRTFLPP